ncbi:hypothetical protein CLOM_g5061 [Closterium sp. NIES-68]|nr:hypothetical protein CLOM_g5061 [Closterium sp. NIES-68]GJP64515.1 hypothetical protein CLOP_g21491 [Closterium sp. NIES-67]
MAEIATAIRHGLGPTANEVDPIIIDYVVNVLKDETFDFGPRGDLAYDAVGPLLLNVGCFPDVSSARAFFQTLAARFGDAHAAASAENVRSLQAPMRMGEGMAEQVLLGEGKTGVIQAVAAEGEDEPMYFVTERDLRKLERNKRKEERQRMDAYEAHVQESEEILASMPLVTVSHGGDGTEGGARDIHLNNFTVTVAGKDLISDASITLAFGRRYGLIGRNGTGKTTLLKHMAMHAIDGIPRSCQVLHVEQEVVGDATTVLECVLSADLERTALLQEEKQLLARKSGPEAGEEEGKKREAGGAEAGAGEDEAAAKRLAEVYKRLEDIDAYSAESRAASILAGLSFTTDMQSRATKTFSGGWRMRVSLARALFIQPDLLLLDEPTNHLDLHAVLWLEDHLLTWPKTLVVVSHAREFLNTVVTDIVHLHNQKLTTYKGNYDTFEKTRNERIRNQNKAAEANDAKRAHIQAFIDKFRYNAKRASLVQSRIKALERIGTVDSVVADPEYRFEFPTPEDRPQAPIISFTDVSFGYPGGPLLFKNLNFGIDLDSRLAIVGPNGIGKTTLLKLISGELKPTSGTAFRSPKVRMAVFAQHHVDGLELSKSPLLYMAHSFPGVPEQKLRSHLGSFGLGGNLALQPMYTLSGGQKSRVSFAKITFHKPHILLLDEPSNHLDIDAVEALIQGLALFQGGVLMVSHDEHLISGSVDQLWAVDKGVAKPFSGTFKEYKRSIKH